MAGRGRGATLPAWMTSGGPELSNGHSGHVDSAPGNGANSAQYADYHPPVSHNGANYPVANDSIGGIASDMAGGGIPSHSSGQRDNRIDSDRRDLDHTRDSRDYRDSRRERGRSNSRERSGYVWHPRDKNRPSNFDVKPPDGVDLPPICVVTAPGNVPNSYFSYVNTGSHTGGTSGRGGQNAYGPSTGSAGGQFSAQHASAYAPQAAKVDPNAPSMQTRHARRLYVGGIPPRATDAEIIEFFNDIILRAMAPVRPSSVPVIKTYMNVEKCYAFVEFCTVELTTACIQLDGIKFEHPTGTTVLRIRRPNDYRADLVPADTPPPPKLNMEVLGTAGATMTNGPGKIFIGGLPYNLTDEQVMELLAAFGPIKQFHQVRDPGSITSKGYGFCEYVDPRNAEDAIAGLNGMQLGEKTLSVRIAVATSGGNANAQQQMKQQQTQQQQQLYGASMMGAGAGVGAGGMGSAALGALGLNLGGAPVTVGGTAGGGANPLMAASIGGMGGMGAAGMANSMGVGNTQYGGMMPTVQAGLSTGLATLPPTKVLKLSNMVTAAELAQDEEYEDIREDVRLECAEYGRVEEVLIPRRQDGFPPAVEGNIFVAFASADMARAAALALNGRKFGDQTVLVQYFDEYKFSSRILA